jgi:hypothetical protein
LASLVARHFAARVFAPRACAAYRFDFRFTHTPTIYRRSAVIVVREVMYCKPGKVRPLVDKFLAMNKLGVKMGMPPMKVMTDFAAERFWTVVAEMEFANLKAMEDMFSMQGQNEQDMKEFENIMKGYHDLVDVGRREVYKLEG